MNEKKIEIKEWKGHKGRVLASVNGFDVIENEARGFAHIIPIPTINEIENVYKHDYYELEKPFYLTLIYVVIFPGLASFFFWMKGIAIIGANRAGVFLHLMPIFGAIMAMLIFNERFMFYHIFGAIFIIAGITLSNKKKINNE